MDRIFELNWFIDLSGMKYKCPSTSCRKEYVLLAPLKKHFEKKHPSCRLVVTKRCRSCSLNLQEEDVKDHRRMHRSAYRYGSPQSSSSSPASVAAREPPEDSSDSSSASPQPNHHDMSSIPTSPPVSCLTSLVTSPPSPQLLNPLAVPFTSSNSTHHPIMSPYPTSPLGSDLTPLVPSPPTPQLLSPSPSPTAPPGPISTVADCSSNDPTTSPCHRDAVTAAPPSPNRRLNASDFFNHRGPLTPPPMNVVPSAFHGNEAEYFRMLSAQLREVIARSPESTSSTDHSSDQPVSPTQQSPSSADPPGFAIPASPTLNTTCGLDPTFATPIVNVGASSCCANVVPHADLSNNARVPPFQRPPSPVNIGASTSTSSTSCANVVPIIPNIPDPLLCPDPLPVDPPPGDDELIAPAEDANDPINIAPDRPVFPNEAIQAIIQAFRDEWLAIFQADSSWDDFSASCENFAQACLTTCILITTSSSNRRPAARRNDRPTARPARPAPDARFRQRFDAAEASRLQGLYRYSRKRAARHVLRLESASFTGTRDDAHNYFENVFSHQPFDTDRLTNFLNDLVPTVDVDESLCADPTPEEISFKLRGMANSAPGKDRVEYRHLRMLDPKCEILALIYSRCVDAMSVPDIWKTATTILIHKRGVTDDVSNFRPIALMSCIYKLLMAVLARRMTTFSIDHGLLSNEQKSARPNEGCYEYSFLLQSVVGDARRLQKNIFVSWLDIRNAFGSVPHDAIFTTLLHMGFPPNLVSFIRNAYTNATTEIKTDAGVTDSVPINSGVKQGCPLSPILFNLALEVVLRAVKKAAADQPRGRCTHHGKDVPILAYADDLVILARHENHLQMLLDSASAAADAAGLSFRPDKCASLSFTNSKRRDNRIELHDFSVQDNVIPAMAAEETYRYLGVPIGLIHNVNHLPDLVDSLIPKIHLIRDSLLAPWQKLDALRTFIQPCLTYALRVGCPTKKSLLAYRSCLLSSIKIICSLPVRATSSYAFASRQCGGLGFQDPTKECDLQVIVQAVKMLASPDPVVAGIAADELAQTVRFASRSEPTPALMSKFLSAEADPRLNDLRHRTQSIWTRTRKAARCLQVKINVDDIDEPKISTVDAGPVQAKVACRFLHVQVRDYFAKELMSCPDQGKVARCLNGDRFATGSSWHFSGLNIRFKDFRFVHKARLNCLPVNAVKHRWSGTSPACRHCATSETLPHILNHCHRNMLLIRDRHNRIVQRLINAVRFGEVTTDRTVDEVGSNLRPDIVVSEADRVAIIDVCCPFDNDVEAFDDAAQRKVHKYEDMRDILRAQGKSCDVFPFVVGSLGSWYSSNELVLKRLGMSLRYRNLFRKLCCSDAIQGSNDIYRHHLGCDEAVVPQQV